MGDKYEVDNEGAVHLLASTGDPSSTAEGVAYYDSSSDELKISDGATFNAIGGGSGTSQLGEVRMFALSMTGAVTKATLQSAGWAICDGTTPATQGISSPTIETTPDLQNNFIRMSNDESSGGSGGSETHNHLWSIKGGSWNAIASANTSTNGLEQSYNSAGTVTGFSNDSGTLVMDGNGDAYTNKISTLPTYYEVAYFMRVK